VEDEASILKTLFERLRALVVSVLKAGGDLPDVMRTAPESQPAETVFFIQPQVLRQPLAILRPKHSIPEVLCDRRYIDPMTNNGMVSFRPGVMAKLGPE
jgi:hypothetical protein